MRSMTTGWNGAGTPLEKLYACARAFPGRGAAHDLAPQQVEHLADCNDCFGFLVGDLGIERAFSSTCTTSTRSKSSSSPNVFAMRDSRAQHGDHIRRLFRFAARRYRLVFV